MSAFISGNYLYRWLRQKPSLWPLLHLDSNSSNRFITDNYGKFEKLSSGNTDEHVEIVFDDKKKKISMRSQELSNTGRG
jgi:hypothetical protein